MGRDLRLKSCDRRLRPGPGATAPETPERAASAAVFERHWGTCRNAPLVPPLVGLSIHRMLPTAQTQRTLGVDEENGSSSGPISKKMTRVMPDPNNGEEQHSAGEATRKQTSIRPLTQVMTLLKKKKAAEGLDISKDGEHLFEKIRHKFEAADVQVSSFDNLVEKFTGLEMVLWNDFLKEVGVELDGRIALVKCISRAISEEEQHINREERERRMFSSKIGINLIDNSSHQDGIETKVQWALFVRSICHQIPVLNIFYVFLFDGAPEEKEVRDILNTMILLSALIVTVVVSYVTSFEVDEIGNWKSTFQEGGIYYCLGETVFEEWYSWFIRDSCNAIGYSSACCLSLVMFYIVSSNLEFNIEDYGFETYHNWWRYARWIICCSVIGLILSLLYMFYAIMDLYIIKFPDQTIKDGACESDWQNWAYNSESSWGYAVNNLKFVLFSGLTATSTFLSLGIRAKFRCESNLPDWPCLSGRWLLLKTEGLAGVRKDIRDRGLMGKGWFDSPEWQEEVTKKNEDRARREGKDFSKRGSNTLNRNASRR